MSINYNDKIFRPISNSENGEVSNETVFHYKQEHNILTSEYSGGRIKYGHLIGLVDKDGNIDMRYHQINDKDELMTGICRSNAKWQNQITRNLGMDIGRQIKRRVNS